MAIQMDCVRRRRAYGGQVVVLQGRTPRNDILQTHPEKISAN
jgi:hypothetical protein